MHHSIQTPFPRNRSGVYRRTAGNPLSHDFRTMQEPHPVFPKLCEEMNWRIEMLGGFRLRHDGTIIERFRTQKSVLLLSYLASFPRRTYSREAIGEFLWPDEDPRIQRNRLRYELSVLRKAVWSDLFHTPDNSQIALAASITGDAAAFEEALRTAAKAATPAEKLPYLETAVTLYKGDFLPGMYDDWVLSERDRLAEAFGDALTQLFVTFDRLGLNDAARQTRKECAERFPDRTLPALRPIAGAATGLRAVAADAARRFHGRETELATLRAFLAGTAPLLTVTGMGGIGKTRLAQEAVSGMPVPLLPLADVFGGDALLQAIVAALPDENESAPSPVVRDAIRERVALRQSPTLLLLDNFEQIRGGADVLAALLRDCPKLRCVVTSQTPLDIPDEISLPLSPLPPVSALALFLDRARSVRPDFAPVGQPQDSNTTTIRAICDLLEGIPLALELAAARVVGLGAGEVLRQLAARLAFLSDNDTVRERRHGSLRATLEWTVNLLPDRVRDRLGAIATFTGGFDLPALQSVCDASPAELLSDLNELRRYSLLFARFAQSGDAGSEQTRWNCLEIVREFADTLLPVGEKRLCKARHATFFVREGKRIAEKSLRGEWRVSSDWLVREHTNVGSAVAYLTSENNADLLAELADTYARFLFENGYWSDCENLLARIEAITPRTTDGEIGRLGLRGAMARRRGDDARAEALWQERLVLQDAGHDDAAAFDTIIDLAGISIDTGQWQKADDYLRRTQTLASTDAAAVMIQVMYARLAFARNDHDAALRHADACLAFASPINDSHGRTLWRDYYITPIFRRHGRVEQAFALVTDALRYSHNGRNSFLSARFCAVLAELWEETGDLNKAGIALYAAQRIHAELGSRSATKSMGLWLRFRQRTASDASLATLWESIVPLPWETLVALLLEDM